MLLTVLALWLTACGASNPGTATAPSAAKPADSSSAAAKPANNSAPAKSAGRVKLILGAYTTPREAYGEIIPAFKKFWKDKTGQDVEFQESYLGSGAQSRAVVEGFEADVVALSLEEDITRIQKAGLITQNWQAKPNKGIITASVAVLLVRKGNPKGLKDWHDLAKPGLSILTPNPKTSGGAMWNVLTLYGAAKRGFVQGVPKDDDKAATEFLKSVLKNVTVFDKGARESITNFEQGVGDVAITYENEAIVGRKRGIILALLFVSFPFVVRTIQPVLMEIDIRQEEAAHTLGASPWVTFRRVLLPALAPAIITGTLLSFARALGEFGSIVVVAGNFPLRSQTAAVYVLGEIESENQRGASAMSLFLMLIASTLNQRRCSVRFIPC